MAAQGRAALHSGCASSDVGLSVDAAHEVPVQNWLSESRSSVQVTSATEVVASDASPQMSPVVHPASQALWVLKASPSAAGKSMLVAGPAVSTSNVRVSEIWFPAGSVPVTVSVYSVSSSNAENGRSALQSNGIVLTVAELSV